MEYIRQENHVDEATMQVPQRSISLEKYKMHLEQVEQLYNDLYPESLEEKRLLLHTFKNDQEGFLEDFKKRFGKCMKRLRNKGENHDLVKVLSMPLGVSEIIFWFAFLAQKFPVEVQLVQMKEMQLEKGIVLVLLLLAKGAIASLPYHRHIKRQGKIVQQTASELSQDVYRLQFYQYVYTLIQEDAMNVMRERAQELQKRVSKKEEELTRSAKNLQRARNQGRNGSDIAILEKQCARLREEHEALQIDQNHFLDRVKIVGVKEKLQGVIDSFEDQIRDCVYHNYPKEHDDAMMLEIAGTQLHQGTLCIESALEVSRDMTSDEVEDPEAIAFQLENTIREGLEVLQIVGRDMKKLGVEWNSNVKLLPEGKQR